MKTLTLALAFILIISSSASAQSVAINTNGSFADSTALLDVSSTSKGLLIPRMTKMQRDSIVAPATGLMVYQTNDSSGFWYYSGVFWSRIDGSSPNKFKQSGTFVAGPSGAGTKTVSFNFPASFSSVPKIVSSPRSEANTNFPDVFALQVKSISATSVTFIILRLDANIPWNQFLLIDYIAWEE